MSRSVWIRLAVYPVLAALIAGLAIGWYVRASRIQREGTKDLIYAATPPSAVDHMIEVAGVTQDDVLYDLGCGDGRIVIAAARKAGCRAVGVELDPHWVAIARDNVRAAQLEHLVEIREADMFQTDLREATIVAVYLSNALNERLVPQLNRMRPGSRFVTFRTGIRHATPDRKDVWREGNQEYIVYRYVTPIPPADE